MIDIDVLRTALDNIATNAVAYMPRLLTSLLILLIGWLIARLASSLIKRIAERIGLEGILTRTGIREGLKKAEINRTGGELLGMLIYWTVFLNFLLISLENLGLAAAVDPLKSFISLLPRIIAALIMLVGGMLLAQFLGRVAQAAMASMGVEFHEQVGSAVNMLLIVMVVIIVLEQVGIDATILTTIFTNALTIIIAGAALAFGLGGRQLARNVLAGYYAREQFSPGDNLIVDGETGTLQGIGTTNSEITVNDQLVVIPNTDLTEKTVKVKL